MRRLAALCLLLVLAGAACASRTASDPPGASGSTPTSPADRRGTAQPAPPSAATPAQPAPPSPPASDAGLSAAPDFTIATIGGGTFRLGDHRGRMPVVLNFWAPW